jgi:hypothetical protein
MKKIPTLFERDWDGDTSRALPAVHPGCEWVLAGEGTATRKLDGTCCMVRGNRLYKRRELRKGERAPPNFEIVDADKETGKIIGWVPVGDGPEDKYHREAFEHLKNAIVTDGTYELIGPKVQGNPENWTDHDLVAHDAFMLVLDEDTPPRTFEGLSAWLADRDIEGIVFHHPDGRMAKIKKRDFGLARGSVTKRR